MTIDKNRWRVAQHNEQQWWMREIARNDFRYFASFAKELERMVAPLIPITGETRILEIGSGPAGILTHLASKFRVAVDPLEPFFRRNEKIRSLRDRNVRYLAAQGESLPFTDNCFDFLIIDNILDHCEDIGSVFNEFRRVLVPGGTVYMKNFTCTMWGIVLGKALEFFTIDRGHPFHFRESDLFRLFSRHRFTLLMINRRGFFRHHFALLSSLKVSHIVKALTLSQADKITAVLRIEK